MNHDQLIDVLVRDLRPLEVIDRRRVARNGLAFCLLAATAILVMAVRDWRRFAALLSGPSVMALGLLVVTFLVAVPTAILLAAPTRGEKAPVWQKFLPSMLWASAAAAHAWTWKLETSIHATHWTVVFMLAACVAAIPLCIVLNLAARLAGINARSVAWNAMVAGLALGAFVAHATAPAETWLDAMAGLYLLPLVVALLLVGQLDRVLSELHRHFARRRTGIIQ